MTVSFKHVSPDLSLPHLELPDWLPGPVADEAKDLYERILQKPRQEGPLSAERRAASLKEIELLCRLASDKRMKNVWGELYRKKRGHLNEFLNPARQKDEEWPPFESKLMPLIHDSKNQDWACQRFLDCAFSLAVQYSPPPKQNEINSRQKPFAKMAIRLRQDAQSLASLRFYEFASDLEAMAIVCDKNTNQPVPDTVVKRSRGDQVLRTYIFRLSKHCREDFGRWLPGTVATTAGVVFSKKIVGPAVRDIMRATTKRRAAPLNAGSKRSGRPRGLVEEFSVNTSDKWAAAAAKQPWWRLIHQLPTNEEMIGSMAYANFNALCDQHDGDPNFDEEKVYEQCLDEARQIVLDKFYQRLYRA